MSAFGHLQAGDPVMVYMPDRTPARMMASVLRVTEFTVFVVMEFAAGELLTQAFHHSGKRMGDQADLFWRLEPAMVQSDG